MEKEIKIMDERIKPTFVWDYNIPLGSYFAEQEDWNVTLMTMINQMAANRVKYYNEAGIKRNNAPLRVPLKLAHLIMNLEYYNHHDEKLAGRFDVQFIISDEDYIEYDGFKLKILNYKEDNMENEFQKEQIKKIVDNKPIDWKQKDTTATTGKGGGLRFNKGKLRYDLVEPRAHRDMVDVLTFGAEKYFDRNWENGLSWTSVIASMKRHLAAIEAGEDYDIGEGGSGKLHIANLACNAHFLNAFYYTFPQGDDRPKRFLKLPKIGLDIDGVLADFTAAWNEIYPEITIKPNSWYFDRNIGERFKQMEKDGTLDDFYLKIKPLINANDLPFEPHCYITSRPVSKEITEQWLDMYNFPRKKVYSVDILKSKVDAAKESGIDIFVDDSFDNFVDLNNNGIFTYLFNTTHNNKHDVGHMRINNLKDIPILQR